MSDVVDRAYHLYESIFPPEQLTVAESGPPELELGTPAVVVSPATDRYAITFFYSPSDEAVAEPLHTCVGPDNPPQYESMSFVEYLAYYSDGNFLHLKRKRGASNESAA